MERLICRLGGARLYLPKRTPEERQRVPCEIVQRFNGRNLFELAREYDLTPATLLCGEK
ncbi:Mor family transcriptional regulator [Variovorax sp. 3319]|nr:Mor family transcriptional regulator [Variovorax sp. 3319]